MNPTFQPSSLLHSNLPNGTLLIHSPLHRLIASEAQNSKLFELTPEDFPIPRDDDPVRPEQQQKESEFSVKFVGHDEYRDKLTRLTRSRVSFTKPLFMKATQNPLLADNHLPLFGHIEPHHAIEALDLLIAKQTAAFETLEATIRKQKHPKYEDVVPVMMNWFDEIGYMLRPFFHLSSTVANEDFQIISEQISRTVEPFQNKIFSSLVIMNALVKIRSGVQWFRINDEQRKLLMGMIDSYVDTGVLMHKRDARKKMNVEQELSLLENKFSDNLVNAAGTYQFVVRKKSQLEGLSEENFAAASKLYTDRNGEGTSTAENGPWLFMNNASSRELILEKCSVRATRRKYFVETDLLNAQGEYDNTPIMTEILKKRAELAAYNDEPNFAEMTISERLAGSGEAVQNTLLSLAGLARSQFRKEQKELKEFAKEQGHKGVIMPWDALYFEKQMQRKNLHLDPDEVKSHYDIESAVDLMVKTASRIFDVLFMDCTSSMDIYHEDVRCFRVLDQSDGRLLGYMYFDPFERTGEKQPGAWMVPLRTRHVHPDGTEDLPVSVVTTNFENSPSGKRISDADLMTLLHETGHALHNILTTVKHRSFSGINNVSWDGVEIPSQFLERFAYDKKFLKDISRENKSGEKISDETLDKIVQLKTYRKATEFTRNAALALTDLLLHAGYDAFANDPENIYDAAAEIATMVTGKKPRYRSHMISRFSHIFAGGYAAGYYGYIWSDMFSADLFSEFKPFHKRPNQLAVVGKRLRDTMFALGGSDRIDKIVQQGFLGREVNPLALMEDLGIKVDEENESSES